MNRRQTKKAYKLALLAVVQPKQDIPTLVGEIQTLAYLVNTKTDRCVFVEYAGHVDVLEVDVRLTKEKKYGDPDNIREGIWFGRADEKNNLKHLVRIRERLHYILEHNELPKEV